ncbi:MULTISPECIES: D-alanine--D-alanine ligase family protein [unclassified Curtobacterium]|uniref:D-alanine--D-alanine ligase family protein n=1 Tax=unclassified Curtobacterium TaxID=257496 RepID=UPI000FBBA33E|nr:MULTISPECIES: D-alanine--D-alanine ligase family protein [unclassified Curtobacterium]ROQ07299.1 D-alanine-D-alanine ligase [Curtobacterium sp. PhB171]ROQ24089.1 D-alanine-D-alanine ligase [Curtobacterium sp. PhB170]ROS36003.1 D-alanine-D-alanine ligase [Curtobacterium sp. PhB131]ROS70112.1 D-alanine-D-alanine ligase [Curtobacterium sp. PhB141]
MPTIPEGTDVPTTTVAVLFGGRSSEHEISCVTAGGIMDVVDRTEYEIVPIGITKDGAFTLQSDDPSQWAIRDGSLPTVPDNGTRVAFPTSPATNELVVSHPDGSVTTVAVDVVFPILHGPFGEDGTIQGLLEIAGLPYVGDGVLASALAMDKHVAKAVLEHAGLRVAPWTTVLRREWAADPVDVAETIAAHGWPLFVKPARAGSSMGVSRVDGPDELGAAMDLAFEHDSKVIVEPRVVGREVEVAVLEGRDGAPRTSLPGEIVVAEDGFYDFASKYLGGDESLLCPAPLTEAQTDEIRSIGARAFEAIGGSGLARVDCFLTDDGFVVNEVNTMPGFTPLSMYPRCWAASGVSYGELVTELIELGRAAVR